MDGNAHRGAHELPDTPPADPRAHIDWMGEKARKVGHDLNNCLGIVSGRSELVLMHLDQGNVEKARGGVEVILGQMDRMKELSDLLRNLRHAK